jgi:hypothetical protein
VDPTGAAPLDARTAFEEVLLRLRRPYRPVPVLELLLGVSRRAAREMAGVALAASTEADRLLETMPSTLRSLAVATTDSPRRCLGGLRGPVAWSETMSARAASAGDPGVFVCSSTSKAYDTGVNRVLVAALDAVRTGGDAAHPRRARHSAAVRSARQQAWRAERFLDHRTLADVPRVTPDARALRDAATGRRRRIYAPAVALLARAGNLLTAASLAAAADRDSLDGAVLLARCLRAADDAAARREVTSPPLDAHLDALVAGPLTYRRTPRRSPEIAVGGIQIRRDVTDEVLVASLTLVQRTPA